MKLLRDLIIKKLELYDEDNLNKKYLKAVWNFYCVYNMCLVITEFKDDKINEKNNLMRRLKIKQLRERISKDMQVVERALAILEKTSEEVNILGSNYQRGMIGINKDDD